MKNKKEKKFIETDEKSSAAVVPHCNHRAPTFRSLNVFEEFVSEADVFAGAFDQTRQIGDGDPARRQTHKLTFPVVLFADQHAQLRLKRREWVGRYGEGNAGGENQH